MLSIVIPSLNEEKYLPLLLESIKEQNLNDYEVILADAGSKDKTLEIAKRYNCIVTTGGLPARGRNQGASIAKGELIFFADSDIILPDGFLDKSLAEFKERNLDIASFRLKTYPRNKFIDYLVEVYYNRPIVFLEKVLPHAAMGILVKKELFNKLNGFDETIKLAEDMDFARRANKIGNFAIIKSVTLYSSDRRAKADGWFKTLNKFILCELHMIFIGPIRSDSDIFEHKFNHYNEKKKKEKTETKKHI